MPETSKTADQALLLLFALAESGPGSATELARRVGLNRTVVHRLLATLVARAFAHRDADGRYQLGMALFELATHVEGRLRAIALPVLESLAARFGETAVLAVADGDDAVPIEQARGARNLMHIDYHPGIRHPLCQGAHGRAILAFVPDATTSRVLEDVPHPNRYARLLGEVRTRGYATSHDELQVGVTGLAAPVFGPGRRVVASIGVVAPTPRFPPEAKAADAVCAAAGEVSTRLGGAQMDGARLGRPRPGAGGPEAGPVVTSAAALPTP